MSAWHSDSPRPGKIKPPQDCGRISDLPAHPVWRAVAWGAMLIAAIMLTAWIAIPAARALVEITTQRPDACRTLTGAECTAWAQQYETKDH